MYKHTKLKKKNKNRKHKKYISKKKIKVGGGVGASTNRIPTMVPANEGMNTRGTTNLSICNLLRGVIKKNSSKNTPSHSTSNTPSPTPLPPISHSASNIPSPTPLPPISHSASSPASSPTSILQNLILSDMHEYNKNVVWKYNINSDIDVINVRKIPFFSQYNNSGIYAYSVYISDMKIWKIYKDIKDDNMFLIYQNIKFINNSKTSANETSNYNISNKNKEKEYLLFRPHGLYINPLVAGAGSVNGNLTIYEYVNKQFILRIDKHINSISWHHGAYSDNSDKIYFTDLNLKNKQRKLYYVEFNITNCNKCIVDYPRIFKGFYILNSYIVNTEPNFIDAIHLTPNNILNFINHNKLIINNNSSNI